MRPLRTQAGGKLHSTRVLQENASKVSRINRRSSKARGDHGREGTGAHAVLYDQMTWLQGQVPDHLCNQVARARPQGPNLTRVADETAEEVHAKLE